MNHSDTARKCQMFAHVCARCSGQAHWYYVSLVLIQSRSCATIKQCLRCVPGRARLVLRLLESHGCHTSLGRNRIHDSYQKNRLVHSQPFRSIFVFSILRTWSRPWRPGAIGSRCWPQLCEGQTFLVSQDQQIAGISFKPRLRSWGISPCLHYKHVLMKFESLDCACTRSKNLNLCRAKAQLLTSNIFKCIRGVRVYI